MKMSMISKCLLLLLMGICEKCKGGSVIAIMDVPRNGSISTLPSFEETSRLGFVKIGIAFAMLFLVLIACGMPILVMFCIQRRADRQTSNLCDRPSAEILNDLGEGSGDAENTNHRNYYEANNSPTNMSSPEHLDSQWTNNSSVPLIEPVGAISNRVGGRRDVFHKQRSIQLWASRITCFAAGVFLSTGFMDLFPEVEEAFTAATSLLKIDSHYPFAAFFTLLGFYLVLMVEQLVVVCHSRHHALYSRPRSVTSTSAAVEDEVSFEEPGMAGGHSHLPSGDSNGSMKRILLLLIALSVHSVFEGLAVGLQRSIADVLALFTALLLHKLIIATSIGVSLATSQQAQKKHNNVDPSEQDRKALKTQVVGTIIFALASPVGVLIGWALVAQRASATLLVVIAVLQGFACGTFFFVVFCEMLPHEFKEGSMDRIAKSFSLILGFVLVAIYMIFEGE